MGEALVSGKVDWWFPPDNSGEKPYLYARRSVLHNRASSFGHTITASVICKDCNLQQGDMPCVDHVELRSRYMATGRKKGSLPALPALPRRACRITTLDKRHPNTAVILQPRLCMSAGLDFGQGLIAEGKSPEPMRRTYLLLLDSMAVRARLGRSWGALEQS